ncbi:MAG: PstS family phosphate ABC transporter substrate-binding protein [Planctomycetota bacterium]
MKRNALALVATLVLAASTHAQTIALRGSDTLGDKMVPKLADAFRKAAGDTNFDIVAEGSSAAFKSLLAGSADIGMSSRPIKDSEKKSLQDAGMKVNEHVAGVDMIAVIVNSENPVDNLPVKGVAAIFTSQVATWKTVPGNPVVNAFTRNESSGTFKVFQSVAMGGAEYGSSTKKMEGNGEIVSAVAADLGGVGYVGLSYAGAKGVRAVKVDGVSAEPRNAATYPLSRNLYYYTIDGKESPEAMKFIRWATTSPEAAKIIGEVGFIAPRR